MMIGCWVKVRGETIYISIYIYIYKIYSYIYILYILLVCKVRNLGEEGVKLRRRHKIKVKGHCIISSMSHYYQESGLGHNNSIFYSFFAQLQSCWLGHIYL